MAIVKQILAAGMPALAAQNCAGSFTAGATATGTNQATAYVLGTAITEFTTAASGTGCVPLSDAAPGDILIVQNNNTGNTITFYPEGSSTINNAASSFAVATNKCAMFIKVSNSHWVSILTA